MSTGHTNQGAHGDHQAQVEAIGPIEADGGEQARMTGDAAQHVGVLVVHLADQHPPPPGAALGGGEDPPPPGAGGLARVGQVDEEQVTKPQGTGDALGEKRAWAVRDYMSTLGLSASRVRVVSYGEERPADAGHNESAWSKNRRAETKVE